jgi:hypothetical protein
MVGRIVLNPQPFHDGSAECPHPAASRASGGLGKSALAGTFDLVDKHFLTVERGRDYEPP